MLLLLLLLSRFSRVQLCATPQTTAHQASPSLGFSRQEHWSGLPFPSPMHESESEVTQSCPTLSNPMDCSLPGSSVHGIFQARVVEWGAIAFSGSSLQKHSNFVLPFRWNETGRQCRLGTMPNSSRPCAPGSLFLPNSLYCILCSPDSWGSLETLPVGLLWARTT